MLAQLLVSASFTILAFNFNKLDSTRKIYEKKLVNLLSKAESGFSTDDNGESSLISLIISFILK